MKPLEYIPEDKQRLFEAFASVELKDSQGDVIPITEFEKVMPKLMSRGAPIQLQHSNHHVGKILNYQIVTKNTPAGRVPALKIIGEIFDDYESQDKVWEAIKNGSLSGISFGGNGITLGKYKVGDDTARLLTDLEAYEFSVVDKPANPEALMEKVSIAKSEIQKPFAGYKDFDACVNANSDKDDPKAYCAAIMQATEKALTADKSRKEGTKTMTEKELPTSESEATPTEEPASNEVAELRAVVEQLATKVAQIEEVLAASQTTETQMAKEGEPAKETLPKVPEEETDKPEGEKDKPEVAIVEKKIAEAIKKGVREELKKMGVTNVPAQRATIEKNVIEQPFNALAIARGQQPFNAMALRNHQIEERRQEIAKALGKTR